MTTADDLRAKAEILGWSVNTYPNGDVFIKGDTYITTDYSRDGMVTGGRRMLFYSVEGTHVTTAVLSGKNKKAMVLSWLADV